MYCMSRFINHKVCKFTKSHVCHCNKTILHPCLTWQAEAERIKVTRESTEEEIGRLKLAEAELEQVREV